APVPGPAGPTGPTGAQGPKGDPGLVMFGGATKLSFFQGPPPADGNSQTYVTFPGLASIGGTISQYTGPYAGVFWFPWQVIQPNGVWFMLSRGDGSTLPNQAHGLYAMAWGT